MTLDEDGCKLDADGKLTIDSPQGLSNWSISKDNYKDNVKSVELSNLGTDAISSILLSGCQNLTRVEILDRNVTKIGESAFAGCSGLKDITLPTGVTSIESWAFKGCSSLESITLPDKLTSIGTWVFADCSSLTGIKIPVGVTSIGYGMFSGCSSLTGIKIPAGVTSIGYGMFSGCSNLKDVICCEL